jgi:DNA-binding IclR family transcriptional regulator
MLLRLPRDEQQEVLAENRRALRSNPAHRRRTYDAMWRRSQQAGLGLNLGDIVPGGASMSAAIVDAAGTPLAAIGVAGPSSAFTDTRIAVMREILVDEALRVGREQADLIAQLGAA